MRQKVTSLLKNGSAPVIGDIRTPASKSQEIGRQKGRFFHDFCHRWRLELDNFRNSMHNARMGHLQHATQHVYTADNSYFVQSYAKINLTLDVLGRRSDGYHELATIMQVIDLSDTLCLSTSNDDDVHLFCTRSELISDDNLVVRAARAVLRHLGLHRGVVIELHKRIPVAAGLGGGSSNAAAVLLALQQWWHLPLSPTDLHTLAAELGSDVPFFLSGGQALCEGRGERVTALPAHWPTSMRWLLLLKPAISISTATVFRNLSPDDYADGSRSGQVCTALRNRSGLQPEDLHNSLERGVLASYPVVAQAREAMLEAGASYVQLSGSGPTLFAPFADLAHASQAQQQLSKQGYEVYLSRAVFPGGEAVRCF